MINNIKHKSLNFLKLAPQLLLVILLCACAGNRRFVAPEPPPDDQRRVPAPQSREINLAADNVSKFGTLQIKNLFDLSRHFRNLFNKPRQAMNVDAFDEVYNSSWFTNRNGLQQLSIEAIIRGPLQGSGPDTAGTWTVVAAKTQGVTPGFTIKDGRGDRYIIKFDPIGYPEMATGAEAVSTRLFHAAGYFVPENYLVKFDPAMLKMGDEVMFMDNAGIQRAMNDRDLDEILENIQKLPDGRIRAIASKFLPGKPMGSFYYQGVRKDDLNDVIPHEHRRELRGLRWIAAWLNHYDTKANNSLDMYDPDGYVKHYLIDFGSTLGSQGNEPMPPEIGREGIFDPPQVVKLVGSLGVYRRPWERDPAIRFPSVGYFVSEDFHPQKYKYILPNPAFLNATNRDAFWATKIVMSFSDAQIRAAVAQGQYSDPAAADYLAKTIIERRDIIGRYWFERLTPLDRFAIAPDADGPGLHFDDLAIETGLAAEDDSRYFAKIWCDEQVIQQEQRLENGRRVALNGWAAKAAQNPGKQWRVELALERGNRRWPHTISIFLEWDETTRVFKPLGIKR